MRASREATISVTAKGAVCLGNAVTCDGFVQNVPIRVQTHAHADHLADFSSSKGYQQIYLTRATLDFLIAEYGADLPYRSNVSAVTCGESVPVDGGGVITLAANGHILGSAQVCCELPTGERLGYSGDFTWPLDDVIQVDQLVLDSTCGDRRAFRRFTYDDVVSELTVLLAERLKYGPVHLRANRGLLGDIAACLDELHAYPIVGSKRCLSESAVIARHGYSSPQCLVLGSPEAHAAVHAGKYIRLYVTGDPLVADEAAGSHIVLSARYCRGEYPVTELGEGHFAVALSKHADFHGSLDYVRATGAKFVLTDSSRGGHAAELARAIRDELGIDAAPSSAKPSLEWGV